MLERFLGIETYLYLHEELSKMFQSRVATYLIYITKMNFLVTYCIILGHQYKYQAYIMTQKANVKTFYFYTDPIDAIVPVVY